MSPNDGVFRRDGISPADSSSRKAGVGLLMARVHSAQAVEALLKLRGETAIGFGHVGEQCVTAGGGPIQQVEERGASGLFLEGDVGVPGDGVGAGFEERHASLVAGAPVDEMNLWIVPGGARSLVYMMATKVATKFQRFVNRQVRKVLVTEHCTC